MTSARAPAGRSAPRQVSTMERNVDLLKIDEMARPTEIERNRDRITAWSAGGTLATPGVVRGSAAKPARPAIPPSSHASDPELDRAIERMRLATIELINGNTEPWKAMCSHRDDASLFGGWGGHERGWAQLEPRYEWAAARFAGGQIEFEEIARYAGADLACTIHYERMRARLVGVEGIVPVNLRVTHVYRREEGGWRLVNRHADDIVALQPTESVIDR